MAPKDLIQSLKDNLERESLFEDQPISFEIQYCDRLAKATVARLVEGRWELFEVMVRPLGTSEAILAK